MDYSASSAEDPGASAWGSSPVASPQHARSSSYGTNDVPPSPTPYTPTRNTSYSQDETIGGGSLYSRPESSAGESVTESEGQRPDTAESVAIDPQSALAGHQQQQQAAQHPQRYHQTARGQQQQSQQHQQQPQQSSQYKLQAKITGLERTGRKDPILRFDVHVSSSDLASSMG